jgi:cation:H+ antiporter
MMDFHAQSVWVSLSIFVIAAGGVWLLGALLTTLADVLAERTGMGRAFAGVLLLGGATSLPEIATTATAAAAGNAVLAGHNLLGGVAMQIAVLAGVDAVALRHRALTFVTPRPVLLMQGVLLILLLAVALATSLPEVSTTYAAVRFGAYGMAVANILGTNSLEVALFFVADLFYRDGLIFAVLNRSALFLGALGIVVTCLYLWGLLERRDKTVLGMGIDSAAVLVLYVGGMIIFSFIR